MVRVVVGHERAAQGVVLFVDVLQELIDVPGRVDDHDLTGGLGADDIGEIVHRTDLNLLQDKVLS